MYSEIANGAEKKLKVIKTKFIGRGKSYLTT